MNPNNTHLLLLPGTRKHGLGPLPSFVAPPPDESTLADLELKRAIKAVLSAKKIAVVVGMPQTIESSFYPYYQIWLSDRIMGQLMRTLLTPFYFSHLTFNHRCWDFYGCQHPRLSFINRSIRLSQIPLPERKAQQRSRSLRYQCLESK